MRPTAIPVDGVAIPALWSYLRLESIDPIRNRFRFFTLQWQTTLWGQQELVCTWGRVGSAGRTRHLAWVDARPLDAVGQLVRRRLLHGYHLVDWR